MIKKNIELPGYPGTCDKVVFTLPFPVSSVKKVYIGKQGCACGCGGNYYASNMAEDNIKTGYKYHDNENDPKKQKLQNRMIKFAYNKVKKLGKTEGIQVIDNKIFSWEGPNRAIRLYLEY